MNTQNRHIHTHHSNLRLYYRFHAGIYDLTRWSFLFGRHQLLHELPDLPSRPRILEVGCGTGSNVDRLQRLFPDAVIYGMDLSSHMLQKADEKVGQSEQVTLINDRYGKEGLDLKPFDLIVLSYTLTMTGSHTEHIIQKVHSDLKPDGYIAVVDFHSTPLGWFENWMSINHVKINERLLSLLGKYFSSSLVEVNAAYLGLWRYFRFIGQPLAENKSRLPEADKPL